MCLIKNKNKTIIVRGLQAHVNLLKHKPGFKRFKIKFQDTPNADGCICFASTHMYIKDAQYPVLFFYAGAAPLLVSDGPYVIVNLEDEAALDKGWKWLTDYLAY